MLKHIFTATFIAVFLFSAGQAQAGKGYLDYAQEYVDTSKKNNSGNTSNSGSTSTSGDTFLDIDNMYDPQYDAPPAETPNMQGCPDGSAPVMGLCGNDIPEPYRN